MMHVAEQLREPLRIDADPFSSSAASPHLGRPLRTAFREIIRQIVLQTPVVLVAGSASTGKTLLVDMTARTCREMGLSVQRIDRGDLVHATHGEKSDLLLVDEADSVADSILAGLSPEAGRHVATTTVFLGLPSCASRFANVHPVIVALTPLPASDARTCLLEWATGSGLPDLFTAEALDLIVKESHGSPRLLRSIAGLAFFGAASDGASQIAVEHVSNVLVAQVPAGTRDVDGGIFMLRSADEMDAEGETAGDIPFDTQKLDGSFDWAFRTDEIPAESRGDTPQFPTGLDSSATATNPCENLEDSSDGSMASSMVRRKTVLAAVCIAVAATVAVAAFVPPMLAGTHASSAPRPASPPAPVPTYGFAAPAQVPEPASPPSGVSGQAKKIIEEAPVLKQAQIAAPTDKEPARGTQAARISVPESAQAKVTTRIPLTAEEEAAVARGIQELERATTEVPPSNRR